MPTALTGIPWDEVRQAYLSENLSLHALAIRFNISESVVTKRSSKYGWNKDRRTIEQSKSAIVGKVTERIMQRSTSNAVEAVASHLERVLTSGGGVLSKLQTKLESALLPDINRLDHLESATRVYRSWDDLIRRAHGLADPTSRIDITTGGLPMHEKALSVLEACTRLVKDGQVKPVDIDVAGLVQELDQNKAGPAATASPSPAAFASPALDPGSQTPDRSGPAPSPSDTLSI